MTAKERQKKVIGYIRVSTDKQELKAKEHEILEYANKHDFGKVEFVSEIISGQTTWKNRKLAKLTEELNEGDIIIVPELSRVGRSLADVLDVLQILSNKKVKVFSVKENFQLNGEDMQSKIMRTFLGLFAEVENDIRTMRIKEGQINAKKRGVVFGRPKGSGKSRLDAHKDNIVKDIKLGIMKKHIAAKYGVTPPALVTWLKKHKLDKIKVDYGK